MLGKFSMRDFFSRLFWQDKKQDDRLPPAYFPFPFSVRKPFDKMKGFFSKTTHHIFLFSQIWNISDFRWKKLTIKVEKRFLRKNIIWYAFYSKFTIFSNLEKHLFFFQKGT